MASLSVTNITLYERNTFSDDTLDYLNVNVLSNKHIMLSFQNEEKDYQGEVVFGEIIGTIINWQTPACFNGETGFISAVSINDYQAALIYEDGDHSYNGTGLTGKSIIATVPTIYPVVGIALESGANNETIKVAISGSVNAFDSLTVGQEYYADESGEMTTTITSRYIGTATASDSIQIKTQFGNDSEFVRKTGDYMTGRLHINDTLSTKEDGVFGDDIYVKDEAIIDGDIKAGDDLDLADDLNVGGYRS